MTTSSKLNFRSCQPKHILTIRTVNLFQYRALVVVALFVELVNTIRAWADAIRMSADSLIVSSNAIRIFLPV